jgi:hypothetical protein
MNKRFRCVINERGAVFSSEVDGAFAHLCSLTSNEPHPGHPKTIYRYMQTSTGI